MASELLFIRLSGVRSDVEEALRERGVSLSGEVGHTESLAQYVRFGLPRGGGVLLTPVTGQWLLIESDAAGNASRSAWAGGTGTSVLVDLVVEQISANVQGRRLASPQRWGRRASSRLTELADELLGLGAAPEFLSLPAEHVVEEDDRGQLKTRRYLGDLEVLTIDADCGPEIYEVRCTPTLGWSLDYAEFEAGSRGRLSLRRALLGLDDGRPEVPVADVSVPDLARFLAHLIELPQATVDAATTAPERIAPTPRHRWADDYDDKNPTPVSPAEAVQWLRWCGFNQAQVLEGTVRDPWCFVTLHNRSSVDRRAIESLHSAATLAGQRGVLFTRTAYATKPARELADKAGLLLFSVRPGEPAAAINRVAADFLPPVEPLPARCDFETCARIGCVMDECPDDVGRFWERG